MTRLQTALSVFWLLLGAGICWQSLPLGLLGPSGPEPGFFPLLAGLLVAGSGAGLLLGHVRREGGTAPSPADSGRFWTERGAALRVGAVVLVTAGMVAAVPHLGFVVAGVLGLPLLFRTVAPGSPWWLALLVGVLASLAVHGLFGVLLGMPLPRGPLGF
jgi:hypothetical protein